MLKNEEKLKRSITEEEKQKEVFFFKKNLF